MREPENFLMASSIKWTERGKVLKELPDKYFFRPGEAAKLIGVHVLTIYRWVNEGKLQTCKTLGGHNRIPRSEIERIRTEREAG